MITEIDQNTALVMIDLQKGILKRETVHPVKDVLRHTVELINAFRKAHLPIVVVNVVPFNSPASKTRKDQQLVSTNSAIQTAAKVAMSMTGFAEIVDEIKTQPEDIFITKNTWNAFYGTSLHDELQQRKITNIVICGVSTGIGVEGTARAAAERGYNVSFAIDAMTDMSEEVHNNSIKYIFPRLGEVGSSADIIALLNKRK